MSDLDLGTLSAKIEVDTRGVSAALGGVKRDLTDVKKDMEKVDKQKIAPKADTSEIEKTGKSAEDAGKKLDDVGKKTVKPKSDTGDLDKAKSSAEQLDTKLGEVDGKQVRPDVDKAPIEEATESTNGLIDSLGKVSSNVIKWSGLAAGGAVIGGVGTAIAKGFSRLDNIDQATAKLDALGNSGSDIRVIMDNALASVSGTAFGIGEAAGTAATMVASGIAPGEQLQGVLQGVADSAAIGGATMEEMGLIWGKAAAKGKIDGEIVAQLLERQLPIYEILSQKTGESAADISKMVSDGKIDFETFSEAMNDYVGGGAVRMGETVGGAMDNFGAALGRGGAAILESGFESLPTVLSAGTSAVDDLTARVSPLAAEWGGKLAPHLEKFANDLGPNVAAGLGMISDGAGILAPLVGNVADAATSIPWQVWAGGITAVVSQQRGWTTALSDGTGKLKENLSTLGGGFMSAMSKAKGAYADGRVGLDSVAAGHRLAAGAAQQNAVGSRDAFTTIDYMGQQASRSFMASTATMGASAKGLASGGISVLGSAMGGVSRAAGGMVTALGGPWGLAIMGATTLIGYLATEHFKAKKAEEEHAAQQRDLMGSLDGTTGSITAQTKAMQEKTATENGWIDTANQIGVSSQIVTDSMNGNQDAMGRVTAAVEAHSTKAVEGTELWAKWGDTLGSVGITASDMAGRFNGSAEATDRVTKGMQELNRQDPDTLAGWTQDAASARDELQELTGGMWELADGVTSSAKATEEAQEQFKSNQIANLGAEAERTAGALELVGDTITSMPDEKTIIVDSLAPNVAEDVRALGGEINRLEDGTVEIHFPDGLSLVQMVQSIGAEMKMLEDGSISIDDNTEEVKTRMLDLGLAVRDEITGEVKLKDNYAEVMGKQVELGAAVHDELTGNVWVNDNVGEVLAGLDALDVAAREIPAGEVRITADTPEARAEIEALGGEVVTLPGGHIAITNTTDENLAQLQEVGITTTNLPPGWIEITDTSDENMKRLGTLGVTTTTLPDGKVVITDNATETSSRIKRILSPELINTVSEHTVNIVRNIKDIFTSGNSEGNVYSEVKAFADGGVDRAVERRRRSTHEPAHTAHIAPAGSYRVFAESETGGEAYIPLAPSKRDRSEKILANVASRFGYTLNGEDGEVRAFANGGVTDSIIGLVGRHFPELKVTSVDRPGENNHHGWGEAVDFSNGTDTTKEMQALSTWFYTLYKSQLAELIHYPLNGWKNIKNGQDFEFGPALNAQHRNHVHVAARKPLRDPLPIDLEGIPDFASLETTGTAGTAMSVRTPETASELLRSTDGEYEYDPEAEERELHGGSGTLIRDGSFLELMAAIYSKQTGTPMDDDIVSWGQVIGLHSKIAEKTAEQRAKDAEKNRKDTEKKLESLDKTRDKLSDKKLDLPEAEEDLRIKRMKRDETYNKKDKDGKLTATETQKASADQTVEKAERKVAELKAEIAEMEAEVEELSLYEGLLSPTTGIGGTSGNKNADAIIREGKRRGISNRGIQIALATALVESEMKMYANHADPASLSFPHDAVGSDHDSVGLFQQRANGAWGTTADRMDPAKSAGMFYDKLDDADYNSGDPGAHAQRVQVSAFPGRYNTRMSEAADLLGKYSSNANVSITPMADGGILTGLNRQAQIQDGSSAVLWAEAGEEAYIPLSSGKQARSRDIWLETGKRLGIDVLSLMNLLGSGIAGLPEGDLSGFNTGGSLSAERLGINMDAAKYRGRSAVDGAVQNAVGAQFYGPVSINDPQQWTKNQLMDAEKLLGQAMKGMR
ncbi:tape measure protein [Corynebacterium sp. A21]|uniref:tape measure protein n=1 Tax=Corynebacterium sp. A21 TaxID=3457318 RepID=UPI003FD23506